MARWLFVFMRYLLIFYLVYLVPHAMVAFAVVLRALMDTTYSVSEVIYARRAFCLFDRFTYDVLNIFCVIFLVMVVDKL